MIYFKISSNYTQIKTCLQNYSENLFLIILKCNLLLENCSFAVSVQKIVINPLSNVSVKVSDRMEITAKRLEITTTEKRL